MRARIRLLLATLFGVVPLAAAGLAPALASAHSSAAAVTVTAADLDNTSSGPAAVRADGLNKWFLYNDTDDTIDNTLGTFTLGPGTPVHGTGSVEFTLGASPDDRANIATYRFGGKALSKITSLSYTAYSKSGVAGANESPFLNFNIDFNGSNTWQDRLVYVPSANMASVPQDTWNTFDTIGGGNALWTWSGYAANGNKWPDGNTNEYRSWHDIVAAFPSAGILSSDPWLGVRVGEPGPANYTGAVDALTFGTAAKTTTFDFEKVRQASGYIVSPATNGRYSKTLQLKAVYDNGGLPGITPVQWAVRQGTCAANTGTMFGNVDGHHDAYGWNGRTFTATLDIRASDPGQYCFVFNPTEAAGQNDVRLTRTFSVKAYVPQDKDDCKWGGWQSYLNPSFKNQGQCVSYVEHHQPHHWFFSSWFHHRHNRR